MAAIDYIQRASSSMTTMARCVDAVTHLQTVIPITAMQEVSPNSITVGMAAMIGDEIVRVVAFTTSSVTVARGCADTIPMAHPANEPIWFMGMSAGTDSREYIAGETIGVKVLPYTPSNVPMDVAAVPPRVLTFNHRFYRPYPPAALTVNGDYWFVRTHPLNAVANTIALAWAHRDRVLQADQLIDYTAGNIGPEVGVTYVVRIYTSANVLMRTVSGVTANNWIYLLEQADADIPYVPGQVRSGYITFCSSRSGYESLQSYRTDFVVHIADPYFNNVTLLLHGHGTNHSTTILDSSAIPQTINLFGSVEINTTVSKFGGSSLHFNGGTDELSFSTVNELEFGYDDFTIESWIYLTDNSTPAVILQSQGAGAVSNEFILYVTATTNVLVFGYGGEPFSTALSSDIGIALNEWTHVAVCRVAGIIRLFINGVAQTINGILTDAVLVGVANSVGQIGRPEGVNSYAFFGYIDDIRVTRMVGRYEADFTPPVATFVEEWSDVHHPNVTLLLHFDGVEASTTFTDYSDSVRTVTPVGAATVTTVNRVAGTGALSTGGATGWLSIASSTDFDLAAGDFTVEMHYAPLSFPGSGQYHTLFSRGLSESSYSYMAVVSSFAGVQQVLLFSSASGAPLLNADVTAWLTIGVFSHLAFVRDGSVYRLYVNGSLVSTDSGPIVNQTQPLLIGTSPEFSWTADGLFDDFRFTAGICRYPNGTTFMPPRIALPDFV